MAIFEFFLYYRLCDYIWGGRLTLISLHSSLASRSVGWFLFCVMLLLLHAHHKFLPPRLLQALYKHSDSEQTKLTSVTGTFFSPFIRSMSLCLSLTLSA